mgnify:CR=1 FL=1
MTEASSLQFIVDSENSLSVSTPYYQAAFEPVEGLWSLRLKRDLASHGTEMAEKLLTRLPIHSCVHALEGSDRFPNRQVAWVGTERSEHRLELAFEAGASVLWDSKRYLFVFAPESVTYYVEVAAEGRRVDDVYYFASDWAERQADGKDGLVRSWRGGRAGFERYYAPRFDWTAGFVYRQPNQSDSLSCQQWLSPPPFCYAWEQDGRWMSCGVVADPGQFNFLGFDYVVSSNGEHSLKLDFEGHTAVGKNGFRSPGIRFGLKRASSGNEAVRGYILALRDRLGLDRAKESAVSPNIPPWWKEPIFCGWGQQRYDYRRDHNGTENGHFLNVGEYATEQKYRSYTAFMREKGIHPGTIIIDYKWAKRDALAEPDPQKWTDMRAFIEDQHALGRKVLLWYSPLLADGLPPEACMTLEGKIVAADPTSERYKTVMTEQLRRMFGDGPGCLNADGLKIDFTQNVPSERGQFRNYLSTSLALLNESSPEHIYPKLGEARTELIQTGGSLWGVELLRAYLHVVYTTMKTVKPDAMLISHTANPYFADVADALRLNDLDGASRDVLDIMRNRATIARMCNPEWLIDTDNDLIVDKDAWRSYLSVQARIGIPVTYYLWGIASSGEPFEEADYAHLRQVWEAYRQVPDSESEWVNS